MKTQTDSDYFDDYFDHLRTITFAGKIYKKFISSPVLYFQARRFGQRIVEIGSGTGSGVLGTFPKRVRGLEINPAAVAYCQAQGMHVQLVRDDGVFPVSDAAFDVCILDNVLEHILDPHITLDECHRITTGNGGLVMAVPGIRGYESDDDHKKFYSEDDLRNLDDRWQLISLFSTPFLIKGERLSRTVKQYCLVATYKKI
jgi:SAM-dependent methyltransferase